VLNKGIEKYLGADDCIFEFDALPRIAADGKLNAFRHDGYWQCMDNLREVEVLNKLWDGGQAPWKIW
jgi:glucose-1-phosphate cytidylyltransferase